jgi:gliding motility-associated-like protein
MRQFLLHTFFKLSMVVLLTNLSVAAFAQPSAPDLRCISIEANGDITLDWIPSVDPNMEFVTYEIYVSFLGVPFVLQNGNLTNIAQNTYTHNGANFGVAGTDYRYYIVTKYNDGVDKYTATSDTLRPIVANLTVNQNVSGVLTWNNIHAPPLPTSNATYRVDRRFASNPPGSWELSLSEPPLGTEVFNDNVARCSDEVFYRVELDDASGCVSRSNAVNAVLESLNGPAPMTYSCITVNRDSGFTHLKWNPHPNTATTNYIIIYRDPNGVAVFIDTVSSNTTDYRDFNISRSAHLASQCYEIAAVDSCGKTQGSSEMHCTMHLRREYDACAGEVSLQWTPYIGCSPVKEYNVYMSINGGFYGQKGTVNGTDTFFVIDGVNAFDTYAFYIEAIFENPDCCPFSHSNVLGTKFQVPDQTKFIRVRSASVVGENQVDLKTFVNRSSPIKRIDIYRALSPEGPFLRVDSTIPNNSVDSFIVVSDKKARPHQVMYYYYLEVIDNCDNPVRRSNLIRTIFLQGEGRKHDYANYLYWNKVNAWDDSNNDVPDYLLWRSIDGEREPEYVVNSTGPIDYTDDIYHNIHDGGEFCYLIELIQRPSLQFPAADPDTCYSNPYCFEYDPDVFIANSFTPNNDGINEGWRPYISFVPTGKYELKVYDRWGKLVFETSDPTVGWDGKTADNVNLEAGQYVYHFVAKSHNGAEIERRGYFSLIR